MVELSVTEFRRVHNNNERRGIQGQTEIAGLGNNLTEDKAAIGGACKQRNPSHELLLKVVLE